MYDWFWNRYYPGRVKTDARQGSGFIFDKRGYAFTNYHVVENAERIQVTLADGKEYVANLLGSAPSYDLALIKIEGGDVYLELPSEAEIEKLMPIKARCDLHEDAASAAE